MKFFKKIIILFCLIYYLAFPCPILAESQFDTSYDISYNVDVTGKTTVRQIVKLTNKMEMIYATQYNIVIGSTEISEVSASDDFGVIKPRIESDEGSTNVILEFDQKMVGRDKTRTINLIYKTNDFAQVRGKVLDVGLPILANSEALSQYSLKLNIPAQFGKATQISAADYQVLTNENIITYIFNAKKIPANKGITATFGSEQLLDFILRYSLFNEYDSKARTEVALPPDTGHQKVLYTKIEPEPENVIVDFDGNWLASYILAPKEKIVVKAYGSVLIKMDYDQEFQQEMSDIERQNWTKPDTYWESNSEEIKILAQSLGSTEAIYDYVVSNFTYDYERLGKELERMGAKKALADPEKAVCMEFTDTFIALTRALGIPAREHNGFAFAENERLRPIIKDQDVLHSWPEFYDEKEKRWIQIDPTWGNTTGGLDYFNKFDLDHFSSVIHGLQSDYPVTVASYKNEDTIGKDIEVKFGQEFKPSQDLALEIIGAQKAKTGLAYQAKVIIFNNGTSAIYKPMIKVGLFQGGNEILKADQEIVVIPPYGMMEIPLEYKSSWKDKGGEYRIVAEGMGRKVERKVEMSQIVSPIVLYAVGGVIGVGLVIIVVRSVKRKAKSLKRKRK